MSSKEIKLTVSNEDYEFLRFEGLKLNMSISGVIKKLISAARKRSLEQKEK